MIGTIKRNPRLRRLALWMLSSPKRPRPRWWVRILRPLLHPAGRGSKISRHARADVFPWHRFTLEQNAQIEDFAVVNNGAGDVRIGEGSRVGIGSVVVGPVDIGRHVFLGQHVSVQGLIHGYEDVTTAPNLQPLMLRPVKVGDYITIKNSPGNVVFGCTFRGWTESNDLYSGVVTPGQSLQVLSDTDIEFVAYYEEDPNWDPGAGGEEGMLPDGLTNSTTQQLQENAGSGVNLTLNNCLLYTSPSPRDCS